MNVNLTTPQRTAKVVADLELAKQNLLTYGWKRFTLGSKECGFCLMGALSEVPAVTPLTYRALAQQIGMSYPMFRGTVPAWNDEQRDKRKVVRLIDRTIRNLENGKIKV